MVKKAEKTLSKITNSKARGRASAKRTHVLIKKAMELSLLCDSKVAVYTYDEARNRLIKYTNDTDGSLKVTIGCENNEGVKTESYRNEDYEQFCDKPIEISRGIRKPRCKKPNAGDSNNEDDTSVDITDTE